MNALEVPIITLTKREETIVALIANGKTNQEIAEFLDISKKTVEKHRENLMRKLNLHNAADVTRYAFFARIIKPGKEWSFFRN